MRRDGTLGKGKVFYDATKQKQAGGVGNPDGMKVLEKLDMKDRQKMEAALKDVKGVKFETKKTVEVTVK